MTSLQLQGENDHKRIGMISSIIFHLLLLLLLIPDFLVYQQVPPGQRGVLVRFGTVEPGGEAASEEEEITEEQMAEPEAGDIVPQTPEADQNTESIRDAVARDAESPVVAEEKDEADAAAERKRQEELRRKEEERKEAARKQKEFEAQKRKFGNVFSEGNSGNEGSGTEGDPSGDPDRSALEKISKGSGMVGGGLTDRGVIFEPEIKDDSQKSGTVVIQICVNTSGEVVSARFTQRGSTTTNKTLVDIATAGARKFKFTASDIEKQCGTVTVNFIVR